MNTSFKLTWIIFVIGIPIFGALFYFILQSNIETKRYRKIFISKHKDFGSIVRRLKRS